MHVYVSHVCLLTVIYQTQPLIKFLWKNLLKNHYTINEKTFYTDGSKLDKDAPSDVSVYSPDFNISITHKLPAETFVFSSKAWAISLAISRTLTVIKR